MAQVCQLCLLFTIERLPLRLKRRGDFPFATARACRSASSERKSLK
jgi:hypothetical protein